MSNLTISQMLPVGTMLDGRYRIEKYLASGGFGNTYAAYDTRFNSRVAVKEFFMHGTNHRDGNSSAVVVSNVANVDGFNQQLDKFRREAKRIFDMRNDHIVHVIDLFDANGTSYYVMDFIEGESLSARVKRGPLTEAEVRDVAAQLLDALGAIHKAGFFHLDVKPGNIMIDKEGHCTLIDFGASKQMSAMELTSLSASGMVFTPGYAPVEQETQRTKSIGPWTDFYAVGATLYNLLTGQRPPEVDPDDTDDDGRQFDYPTGVSTVMRRAISCMMNPSPRKRPQNVEQMKAALEGRFDILSQNVVVQQDNPEGTVAYPSFGEKPISSLAEKPSSPKWVWITIALLVVLTTGGLLLIFGHKDDASSDIAEVENNEGQSEQPFGTMYIHEKYEYKNTTAKVKLDYPTQGPPVLVESVRTYMNNLLAEDKYWDGNWERYSDDMNDGKAMAAFYAKQYAVNLLDGDDEEFDFSSSEKYVEIIKRSETNLFVSYKTFSSTMVAGSNNTPYEEGVTFKKSDGKIVKNILKNTDSAKFKKMVLDALNKEINEDFGTSNFTIDNDNINMWSPPFISEYGVVLLYSSSEVGLGGHIVFEVTLGWWEVKEFLTEEALALCPIDSTDVAQKQEETKNMNMLEEVLIVMADVEEGKQDLKKTRFKLLYKKDGLSYYGYDAAIYPNSENPSGVEMVALSSDACIVEVESEYLTGAYVFFKEKTTAEEFMREAVDYGLYDDNDDRYLIPDKKLAQGGIVKVDNYSQFKSCFIHLLSKQYEKNDEGWYVYDIAIPRV